MLVVLELHLEQLEIAGDDRQQIVEIVRDAARQLAYRLHALGFAQGLVLDDLLADIANEGKKTYESAILVAKRGYHRFGGEYLTRLATKTDCPRVQRLLLLQTLAGLLNLLVLRRGFIEGGRGCPDDFLGRVTEHAHHGRIAQRNLVLRIDDEYGLRQMIEYGLEQGLLRQHARSLLRKIMQDAGKVLLALRLECTHRQVNRKDCSTLAARHHLSADADDLALPGFQMVANIAVVAAAKRLGHKSVDVASDELSIGESEHFFDCGIEGANKPLVVDDDNGAHGRLERGLQHLRAEVLASNRLAGIGHAKAP